MTPNTNQAQAPQGAPQDQGLDVDKQIQEGVAAFMQSQDPAIAVQVVTMMAEMMGIAPAVDPYAQAGQSAGAPAPAPAPEGGQPMARNGMKAFRIGGKIKMFKRGGSVDPQKKK